MKLIRGIHNLKPPSQGSVVTIGNFDGVHRGHQAVIAELCSQAKQLNLPSVLITFEPHPREFFTPQNAPARLTRLREKLVLLQNTDLDNTLCLRFNRQLADMPAEQFIKTLLVDTLKVRHLIVGNDFRFGKDRIGDFAMLESASADYGFNLAPLPKIMHPTLQGSQRISSTWVRDCLAAGDLDTAETLLGRPYSMCGRIVHGDKRGRIIGFPTANIFLHRQVSPLNGVFAVTMKGLAEHTLPGVANIGVRPTFAGSHGLLEVHLFDFQDEIYHRYVTIEFKRKLRDEKRFDSFELLQQQIKLDAQTARGFFAKRLV